MTGVRRVVLPAGSRPEDLAIVRAANEGDENARKPLRALIAARPELVERVGTLGAQAEAAILGLGSGGNVLLEEAGRFELNEMRRRLAEPADNALERLLVERVALCWLALTQAEQERAGKWNDGVPVEIGDFWDRHVGRLHTDFLRACATLARVRRLRLPAVQVNIAEKQVNLAG